LEDWPRKEPREVGSPIIVGRHSRPDPLKWPNRRVEALSAYPDDAAKYQIRILGAGPYLHELYQPIPGNWELLPFSWDGIPEFLQSLDFYVYFHSDEWAEAFGRTVLEALAVGLVVILPPSFRETFAEAAVYAEPQEVHDV
ncbi:glycosyltransferase, partial [Salinisphaera sp. USBA-960]|nr:glycosyltransferase [Salifodinibacter halophilus]